MRRLIIALLILLLLSQSVSAQQLIPGGQLLGIRLAEGSITVVSFEGEENNPARAAGLQLGDRITAVDGRTVSSICQLQQALNRADGPVQLQISRKGQEKSLRLLPQLTDQGPRLGIGLTEGITGVGTLTYYDPEDGTFGALGHGVNDGTGKRVSPGRGSIFPATVLSVRPGKAGQPGQILGTLAGAAPIGSLEKNTAVGIFGQLQQPPQRQPLSTGQAQTGPATIFSTLDSSGVQEYSVEILKIYPKPRSDGRNLLLKITDEALLRTTGGIIQGMSGSPIIQDGKLVGAVTHVLVNDPTTGYGIFIENMLDAAA